MRDLGGYPPMDICYAALHRYSEIAGLGIDGRIMLAKG